VQAFNTAYPWIVLYIGLFDAAVTLVGGLVVAAAVLRGEEQDLYERVFPAFIVLIMATVSSVLLLAGTRWILGG
jgi:hypothetical protein